MKELDLLLTRYVDERFAAAPAAEQQAFEHLLQLSDPLLHAYCLGQAPVPADLKSVLENITAPGASTPGRPRC
jgi:succinate dehydrogenase flavin-adding protein (antitoxin of CptAB toxin-antitoxin module)